MKITSLLTFFLLCSYCLIAQRKFNEYQTISSVGKINEDFTLSTRDKFDRDIKLHKTDLSKSQEKDFYEGVHYAIDELLHSGMVVYGDPISVYGNDILDKLLAKNKGLRKELRLYTIKSNVSNAFATDQGIIFITTGLVSQLTSEAQLAYILAHEISHYTEKHIVETYDWKLKNSRHKDRIERLGNYSKEKEFSADKLGVKLYHDAGYAQEEVVKTFDVLMYSYLPFDEVKFPIDYFNNEFIFIPENQFPDKAYPIKAEEDYDDSEHTHPNIKKRKDSVEIELTLHANWGNNLFHYTEERFLEIRNIARFESIRSDLLDANYGNALYSIFLLEREFPTSIYLKRSKAHAWLNLIMYAKEFKSNRTVSKISDLEGESATLHYFLRKSKNQAIKTLGLRVIYDLHNEYPKDEEISLIYKSAVDALGWDEKFDLDKYSSQTFTEAINEFNKQVKDTSSIVVTNSTELSKYDRINRRKTKNENDDFDSTKYYIYALSDLKEDNLFKELLLASQTELESSKQDELARKNMSSSELKKLYKKTIYPELLKSGDNLIIVDPTAISYKGREIDPLKSEEIGHNFAEMIEVAAREQGINTQVISRQNLEKQATEGYNDRNILISFLSQISNEEDVNELPIDYQLLHQLKDKYNSRYVLFSLVEHYKDIDINWWYVGMSFVLYPTLPYTLLVYIPSQIIQSNNTILNYIVLDLENGEVAYLDNDYLNEPLKKHNMGAHFYDVFYRLTQTPR